MMTKTIVATLLAATSLSHPAQAADVRDIMGSIIASPESVEVLDAKCDTYVEGVEERRSAIIGGTGTATVENTLVPYDEITALINAGLGEFSLYQQVMLTPELRDAGGACAVRLTSLNSEISLSRPIYDRLAAVGTSSADELTQSYLTDTLAAFERAGVALDDEQRARVQEIQDEMAQISTELARNIAEDVRSVKARPEELAGLPQDFIDAHELDEDGMITLTTASTDYQPVMSYASSDELRQRFSVAYTQRAWPQNDAPLARLFELRSELARLLGRPDFATLALEDKMLDTPSKVIELMAETNRVARPVAQRDYEMILEAFRSVEPDAQWLEYWQQGYAQTLAQGMFFSYDPQETRQYFTYNNVRDGVFKLTEDLFGVEIRRWDTPVWNEDVEAFEMLDNGEVIGRFYFDSHPRPGKYTHANMIPIYPGVPGEDVPVGALVQNLPAGDYDTGLMEHGQVETLLHEFGHMIHGMFGGTQHYFGQNFLTVEWDVVEAPSQMLENWVYDYDTLANFARNEEGETIPRELVERMNRVRYFGQGMFEMGQLGLTNTSFEFHRQNVPTDLGVAMRAWYNEYAMVQLPNYTQRQASFGHLDGYSAFYYTYLWSRVVAADLFAQFEAAGIRNRDVANRYRETILAPGGTKPAEEIVRDFLGRDVELDAFREGLEKGLQ